MSKGQFWHLIHKHSRNCYFLGTIRQINSLAYIGLNDFLIYSWYSKTRTSYLLRNR